ncbi:MAG: glucosamine-6-phosphate deaminase [Actinobacteria bacterium]|nr:glucosamine-6-phosphate deaminase [Actinomycetota bacterium]
MSLQLEVFEDDQWADRVAQRWIAYMQEHPTARLCLPTGETPRPVYARCAPVLDLSAAVVFVLDEYDLPPESPARCVAMLRRDFLGALARPPAEIHALDVDAPDPEAECRRFEALVDDGGLSLTLLGLGINGHLGLNEPGTTPDAPTRVVRLDTATTIAAARYDPNAKPTRGMTLGLRPILDSREIWLLVTGSHKAATLERALNGPIGPDLPAGYLRRHPNATVFADRSAAAAL